MRAEWELYARGAQAAEDILRSVYGVEVRKGLNPLKLRDFERIVRSLALSLKDQVVPVEDLALKRAMGKLDANWTDMGPEARGKLIGEAAHYLGPPVVAQVLPKIDQTLAFAAKDLIPETKKNAVLTYDLSISPSLNATDERIAKYVRVSQGHFITNRYGDRVAGFADQARDIVASGLEKGLGSEDIGDRLHTELGYGQAQNVERGAGYWNMIAMVFANRARTMTQLASFHEAGITAYVWESVLDEATSVQCRFMHGRVFPVAHAMQRFEDVENADSPEDIKILQPFVSRGRDGDHDALVFGRGEDRRVAAHVTDDAVGRKDEVGSYANAMDDGALAAAGVMAPPIHGNCRSTIVPEFGGGGGGKPVPAAPPPQAPKPTSGQKKATALENLNASTIGGQGYFGMPGLGTMPAAAANYATGDSAAPFLAHPMFLQGSNETIASDWLANAEPKKPKLEELTPTELRFDAALTAKYIQNSKALAAASKPKIVQYKDALYILDGHEQLMAQKLLGQKTAYVDLVNLDKTLKPGVVLPPAAAPAVVHDALTDPDKTVVWGKMPLHEGKSLNGVPLAPAEANYWEKVKDKTNFTEPELPAGKVSAGCVVVEDDGRVWIVEPKEHFGGYEHTFPKGTLEKGLSTQQNALKELYEEAGLRAEITGHLGDYKGDTGTTRYFIAHRTGGAPWAAHWESENVKLVPVADAEKLLNKARDKKVLADFVKTLGQPKAPEPGQISLPFAAFSPAMAPPAPAPTAGVVLGARVGPQTGSNPGGTYFGTDGVLRYVKFYNDPLQAHTEHLANQVYRDLGHVAPKSVTFEHKGKTAYASEMIKDVKTLESLELTPELAQKAMKGFIGDVLTANWDAAGYSLDNMVLTPGGDVARIDNGGSFLLRARGERKPVTVLNQIFEWESFFGTDNASYRKIANAAGYPNARALKDVIIPEVDKVVALRDAHGGWAGYVEKTAGGMASADKQRIVEMLEARTTLLQGKAAALRLLPDRKVFPKGSAFVAPAGERVKAPSIHDDLVKVQALEDLPIRDSPDDLRTPPGGESSNVYNRNVGMKIQGASAAAREVITDFTGSASTRIRAAQTLTRKQWESNRKLADHSYDQFKEAGETLETAFGKVEAQPGQVFRGIGQLSRATIDRLMKENEFSMAGASSVSRHSSVARGFMGGMSGDDYRTMFVIHQKSAIGIETISNSPGEYELLMSNRARFRVLARHRATENPNCLIIECEEIEGLVPMPSESGKKPRARRKPKVASMDGGGVDVMGASALPFSVPPDFPQYGELDGKQVELRKMTRDELQMVVVELPGGVRIRPWKSDSNVGFPQ